MGDWKLLRHGREKAGPWEFYNLRDDLGESRNLADRHPEWVEKLRAVWERLDREMSEPAFW